MVDLNKIQDGLDKMMEAVMLMKQGFRDGGEITVQSIGPKATTCKAASSKTTVTAQASQSLDQYLGIANPGNELELLKAALKNPKWPDAVNANLICDPNSDQDKIERGKGIIELMIEEDLKGLKYLDIGCGEGHTVAVSADYSPTIAVGYDQKQYPNWSQIPAKDNLRFTTDFEEVSKLGPFDVITIFDVLDHSMEEDPVILLEKAREVLADMGKIYLRCHPWISRHGTHLYHSLNKAYAHILFSDEELSEIIPQPKFVEPSRQIVRPIATYDQYIKLANLVTLNRREITEKPEPFFRLPSLEKRICQRTKMPNFPEYQMSVQFVDYVLAKAKPDITAAK